MAPNRSRSNSNANQRSFSPNVPRQTPRQRPRRGSGQAAPSPTPTPARTATAVRVDHTPTPEPSFDVGMSPASRYYKNLRVLRRHDPHIVSIFDQFAHVTLYYQPEPDKFERGGYEGVMFFFERDIQPVYGFFILNRQGMNDYIRYLLPSDVVDPIENLVWISTMDHAKPSIMGDQNKTAGLWAMPMDDCITRGVPYPEEHRYGPDRIAPQQICYEGDMGDDGSGYYDWSKGMSDEKRTKVINAIQENAKTKGKEKEKASSPPAQTNMSELDQLFSKLAPAAKQSPDPAPLAPQPPLSGLALLNTMFASVSEPVISQPNGKLTLEQLGLAPTVSSPPQDMEILSPKPSAAGLPQILTADVIHELMGLPLSDSRSVSRTSTFASEHPRSPSSVGAHRSTEHGYFADRGEDDGGASEASMSVDVEDRSDTNVFERLEAGGPRSSFLTAASSGTVNGDATPRARAEPLGLASPPTRTRPNVIHAVSDVHVPSLGVGMAPNANRRSSGQAATATRTVSAPSTVRAPFQSGAELWPDGGSAAGVSASTSVNGAKREEPVEEVVELDFSEIGVLEDIRAFEAKGASNGRKGEGVGKTKEKTNGVHSNGVNGAPMNGPTSPRASRQSARPSKRERERQRSVKPNGEAVASAPVPSQNVTSINGINMRSSTPQASIHTDVRKDVAESSLRAALLESGLIRADGQAMERNAFVREVLTLIHTDKAFVDRLYQTYTSLVADSTYAP
ncbi:hypothetical protein DFH11DRAFT_1542919 [Phellopilus nigrolimitatus]|nr:hypothetical protein DFH11DRAFT_1542919 [Phellopilus nigrolimitatus]